MKATKNRPSPTSGTRVRPATARPGRSGGARDGARTGTRGNRRRVKARALGPGRRRGGRGGRATERPWVGIAAAAYDLPPTIRTLGELAEAGLLESRVELLESFGFKNVHVADGLTHMDLAQRAVKKLFDTTGEDPERVDVLIHSGSITPSSMVVEGAPHPEAYLHVPNFMDFFKYPASKLQYDFGMTRATCIGIGQQSCTSLFAAIRAGRDILLAEDDLETVLCVSSDAFPPRSKREVLLNVISDGAAAVLLRRGSPTNKILSHAQITKGYYWDCDALKNEIIAAYFPSARTVIETALAKAKLTMPDIDLLLPHNVSVRSWSILLGLLGFPRDRFYGENIARRGHSIAADNIVNLCDAVAEGRFKKGQRALLFNYGFGAHWTCAVVEH